MQLAAAATCLLREDANLGHQIVMDLALDLERRFDVDLAGVRAQIVDLGLLDQPLGGLRFGQRDPYGAPEPAALFSEKSERKLARPYLHENGEA